MKEILKFIPGFRTGAKWKIIIAGIYYLFCLMLLTAGIGIFLFAVSIPFVIFYVIRAFKLRKREPVIFAIIAFIVLCLGLRLSPTTQMNAPSKASVSSNKNHTTTTKKSNTENKANSAPAVSKSENKPQNQLVNGQLKVHFIDVGQGDSILVQNNGQNMLIDTGTNASTSSLIGYLQSQNIKKIDYLVLTHPHEDHIGGADAVIKTFDIGIIYMNQKSTTTNTYRDVINAIASKGIRPVQPALGTTFKVGTANCIVYGPVNPNSDDLNTYSIVIKLTFGNNKFLFTGDTQASNEEGMINNGYDLSADVLKVAHHGSHTSTLNIFLDKVNPKYAVISLGKGNDYGHPHKETMDRLKAKNTSVYRTDENGTIVSTSDGNNISFNCNPGDYANGGSVISKGNVSTGNNNNVNSNTSVSTPQPAPALAPQHTPQPPVSTPASQSNGSANEYVDLNGNGLIKGNINSKGEKIYHLPGDQWYDRTKAERWFKTVQEAEAAGFRAPLK